VAVAGIIDGIWFSAVRSSRHARRFAGAGCVVAAIVCALALATVVTSDSSASVVDCPGGAFPAPAPGPAPLLNAALLCGAAPSLQGVPPMLTGSALFAASDSQIEALRRLEASAAQDAVIDHGLSVSSQHISSTDTAAAQTWGRATALAELWGILLQ